MESNALLKGLQRFPKDCIMNTSVEIGPRIRLGLTGNNLVPFSSSVISKEVLI